MLCNQSPNWFLTFAFSSAEAQSSKQLSLSSYPDVQILSPHSTEVLLCWQSEAQLNNVSPDSQTELPHTFLVEVCCGSYLFNFASRNCTLSFNCLISSSNDLIY